jgi:hypothetical protein
MWAASDDDFCQAGDISSMMLFVGDHETSMTGLKTRICHLVIPDTDYNQTFTMSYRMWAPRGNTYAFGATLTFDGDSIWPEHVDVCVDIISGSIKIHRDGVLYAKLYKQSDISDYCGSMSKSEVI